MDQIRDGRRRKAAASSCDRYFTLMVCPALPSRLIGLYAVVKVRPRPAMCSKSPGSSRLFAVCGK